MPHPDISSVHCDNPTKTTCRAFWPEFEFGSKLRSAQDRISKRPFGKIDSSKPQNLKHRPFENHFFFINGCFWAIPHVGSLPIKHHLKSILQTQSQAAKTILSKHLEQNRSATQRRLPKTNLKEHTHLQQRYLPSPQEHSRKPFQTTLNPKPSFPQRHELAIPTGGSKSTSRFTSSPKQVFFEKTTISPLVQRL